MKELIATVGTINSEYLKVGDAVEIIECNHDGKYNGITGTIEKIDSSNIPYNIHYKTSDSYNSTWAKRVKKIEENSIVRGYKGIKVGDEVTVIEFADITNFTREFRGQKGVVIEIDFKDPKYPFCVSFPTYTYGAWAASVELVTLRPEYGNSINVSDSSGSMTDDNHIVKMSAVDFIEPITFYNDDEDEIDFKIAAQPKPIC